MSDQLAVVVGNSLAGWITRAAGRLELTYDDAYRRDALATPLSVSLPLDTARHRTAAVGSWLAGLLPDDPAVLRRWGRMFSVSSSSPFSLLGTPVGEECAGAARFVRADRVEAALSGDGDVVWLAESDVAERLRELRADSTAWLGTRFSGRFSLAGAQAKTALLWDAEHDRWGVPSGAASTSHIFKPAIVGLEDHDLNEHLCLRSAAMMGLVCAASQILTFEDQSAVVSTRYDRVASAEGWLTRVHQEDLCQALGLAPDRKYQNEGGPSTTAICGVLRRVVPADHVNVDLWRFFDAVTFNWLIGGTDAHAKNYSLLLAGRQVRLAPLYDVACALPYPAVQLPKLRMAMKFGSYYTLDDRRETMWSRVAGEFSLPVEAVRLRAASLMDRLPAAIDDCAASPEVIALKSPLPSRLVDAVAQRVSQLRKATLRGPHRPSRSS